MPASMFMAPRRLRRFPLSSPNTRMLASVDNLQAVAKASGCPRMYALSLSPIKLQQRDRVW